MLTEVDLLRALHLHMVQEHNWGKVNAQDPLKKEIQLIATVASRWLQALSEDDQAKDSKVASTTTAQILGDAVRADQIPSDPLTRDHFGLSKVNSYEEETCLMGLYSGLLLFLPRPPSLATLQGWQENDKLADGIYHTYKSQKGESSYFIWFKKNQHLVSQSYQRPEGVWEWKGGPVEIDKQKFKATLSDNKGKNKGSKA